MQISVLLGYTELWIAIIFRKKEIECIETIPLRENCWKNDLEVVSYNQNIMYILYMYHNTCTINNDLLKKTCCIIGHHSLFCLVKKDFCSHSVSLLPSFDKITACHLVQSYQMSKHYISIWFLVCKWIFTDLFQLWYKINLRFESFCKILLFPLVKSKNGKHPLDNVHQFTSNHNKFPHSLCCSCRYFKSIYIFSIL